MSSQNTQKKKEKFLELYKIKTCNISATCEAVGISRRNFYKWLKKDGKFAQAVKDAENSLIDEAEAQLFKNIKDGKETSLIFFLTNRAKDRWQDRRNIHHSGKVQVEKIEVEFVENNGKSKTTSDKGSKKDT